MPKYNVKIEHIVSYDETQSLINRTKSDRNKFIIAVLYLTGARPQELCYNKIANDGLKKEDIKEVGKNIHITIKTIKLRKTTKFRIDDRELVFDKRVPFIKEVLKWHKKCPGEYLLKISTSRLRDVVYRLSDKKLCPYNFRHSRMTKLAKEGAPDEYLMYWKGARDQRSVRPYKHAKPRGGEFPIK